MNNKNVLAVLILALASLTPATASAQVHAQLGPAAILDKDARFGAFAVVGDDQVGALVDGRFLLTLGLDLGLQAGWRHFSNVEAGEDVFDAGVDVRFGMLEVSDGDNFDLSAGGGFGLSTGDDLTILTWMFQLSGSKPLYTSGGREITPYGGLLLSIAHTKVDVPEEENEFSDPDLDVILRLGLAADISESAAITGELQIKEDPSLYLGVSTSF